MGQRSVVRLWRFMRACRSLISGRKKVSRSDQHHQEQTNGSEPSSIYQVDAEGRLLTIEWRRRTETMVRPSIRTPLWRQNKMKPSQINPQHGFDLGEYLEGLYSYAVVLSKNRSDAEDLVQETCLRAITGMNRMWPDSNVKSWLFTILRNVWLNHLRQRRAAPDLVELAADESVANSLADNGKDPHADLVSQFEREQVRAAIQQLSVEFREV